MNFRIADTFTDSLARLTGDEQKAVKTTAFDLQLDPTAPGMSFHKHDRAKDKNFWSVRVSRDIRLIVHRTEGSLLLCYADHHDKAYAWAERRRLETHPKTGAAQLVEIRERVEEIVVPRYVEQEIAPPPTPVAPPTSDAAPPVAVPAPKPRLFATTSPDHLLKYGVPPEWIDDVLAADEDALLRLVDHLPREAAEALLDLATGTTPRVPEPAAAAADPFAHPDAQRRFRVVNDVEELERALEYPWEKWTIFLHPAQREAVEREYRGPARIAGTAGTGKTIVALHRAVFLARKHPDSRVLLTTFSAPLANALRTKLERLLGNEPRIAERLEVHGLDEIAERLHELNFGGGHPVTRARIREELSAAASAAAKETSAAAANSAGASGAPKFSAGFLLSEWENVVDGWQIDSWESYRDVARLGRKTRLPEKQRAALWAIFDRVRTSLTSQGAPTRAAMFARLSSHFAAGARPPFDFVVVDEAQDVSVPQLRFLAAIGQSRPDALFFAGDLGQRIFQAPFSWRSLGVDVRGRSKTLRVNYRTSHQIRAHADRLLGPEVTDVDGNCEDRRGAISVFNGPEPTVAVFDTVEAEAAAAGEWLARRFTEGVKPHEAAVFVRSEGEVARAKTAIEKAGAAAAILDENVETAHEHVSLATMHLAKGLEFRCVVVMACDDEVLPLQSRIESVTDDADLEDVYETERHLLYVACTRARDHLLVTGHSPASEFLDDLLQK